MLKISLTVITFNEEKNIARCLNSVLGLVDEIVIIDSFSTDKTKEICLDFAQKHAQKHTQELQFVFLENPFSGHIAQKNYAISKTNNSFILSLDADEALSDTLKANILAIKQNAATNSLATVYEMPRLTNYCGSWIKHTDWYPDKKIRLFDKNIAYWGGTDPHDSIIPDKNIALQTLKGDILHYSYYSIKQHIQQLDKFTDINAKEAFLRGKKASFMKIFGSPLLKFSSSYFVRLGFLDGYAGFLVCAISAFASFVKYIKLRELWKNKTD